MDSALLITMLPVVGFGLAGIAWGLHDLTKEIKGLRKDLVRHSEALEPILAALVAGSSKE